MSHHSRITQGMWAYNLSSSQIMSKVRPVQNGPNILGFIALNRRPLSHIHLGRILLNPRLDNYIQW
eukprot:3853332-Ditylum_brightwellii.AAC.1